MQLQISWSNWFYLDARSDYFRSKKSTTNFSFFYACYKCEWRGKCYQILYLLFLSVYVVFYMDNAYWNLRSVRKSCSNGPRVVLWMDKCWITKSAKKAVLTFTGYGGRPYACTCKRTMTFFMNKLDQSAYALCKHSEQANHKTYRWNLTDLKMKAYP